MTNKYDLITPLIVCIIDSIIDEYGAEIQKSEAGKTQNQANNRHVGECPIIKPIF